MSEIKIILLDGSEIKLNKGTTLYAAAAKINKKLGKEAIAGIVNGVEKDLNYVLEDNDRVEIITFASPGGREIYHHSSSHIMAQAVKELFPQAKLAIGPAIKDGFYYDFDLNRSFTPEDILLIEKKMKEIVGRNLLLKRIEVSKKEAHELFKKQKEDYKIELLKDIEDSIVTLYQQGDFIDLCRGPHIPSTGKLKTFKYCRCILEGK